MEELIKQYCKEKNIQGISVCIHDHGKRVFSYAGGKKDETGLVDTHTRFTIGSISKLFVTVAILQLSENNKLDLDQPVYHYLKDFIMADERYQLITVRMLLNHSSGLPSTTFKGKYTNHYYPQYIKDMLDFYRVEPLKSEPGKYSVYCNDGFVLAQYLVETLSHQTFREYCIAHITKPALMKDTEFPGAILSSGSYALAPNDYEQDFAQEFVNGIGSGGVYSTAADLCLFLDALQNSVLLNTVSYQEMIKPQFYRHVHSLELNANGYGLGFDHVEMPCFKAMGLQAMAKGGATFGYLSYAYMIPQNHLSVAILSTSNEVGVTPLAKQLGKLYLQSQSLPTTIKRPQQAEDISGVYGADNRVYQITQENNKMALAYYQFGVLTAPIYLDNKEGEYYYDGPLFGFDHPRFGFIKENDETYMYVTYFDENVEVRSLIGQKIKKGHKHEMSIPGKYYLKLNEYVDQRTFYTQDLHVLAPVILKDYDCVLTPFPLKIIANNNAIPFIELPGSYSREMCQLHISDDGIIHLGPYHYIDAQTISSLPNTIDLESEDTQWFTYNKMVTINKPNDVRVIGIQLLANQAKVCFDSLYCKQIPETLDYIGFMGKAGDHIDIR